MKWQLDFYADTPKNERNKRFSFRLPYQGPSYVRALDCAIKRLEGYFKPRGFYIRKWYVNQLDHKKAQAR